MPENAAVHIDFSNHQLSHRLGQLRGRNELLAKAIGFRAERPVSVFDTTAGTGTESILLAALGCDVTLFERHPDVAAALKAAIQAGQQSETLAPILKGMQLHMGCAIAYMQAHPDTRPDIIYCDPMFYPREKSAASKKEITALQTLVGHDVDDEALVALALERAQKRVVVKRAKKAPHLVKAPTFSLKARSHRFDVYALSRL